MAGFTLTKVDFGNTPSANQTLTFEYKLWSAPLSSYSLIGSSLVDVNGNILASPVLKVTGLTAGQLYYVRAYNNCSSPIEYFIMQIQL